jgi:hypothetical protein
MPQRAIYRCMNKDCKHIWAREYELQGRITYYRMEGDTKILQVLDFQCPKCKSSRTKCNWVQGVLKEGHKCDIRCTRAIGAKCTCECSGSNHGVLWLEAKI